jgi:hypothetical protein
MFELTTWKHSAEPYAGSFQVLAVITCPGCKHEWILSGKVHKVMADGSVAPSVVCPLEGCGFHEFVTLKDWTPPEWFMAHTMESFVADVTGEI